MSWWRAWPLAVLVTFQVAGWIGGPRAGRLQADAAWPSLAHPLGIDGRGRDFAWIVVHGAERFTAAGLAAAALLVVLVVLYAAWSHDREVGLHRLVRAAASWAGTMPRLLVVLLVMMALPEPNVWVMAAVLLVLYLPVALDEAAVRLEALQRERVLLGARAHGLSPWRIAVHHLALGHLRPALLAHAAYLFVQVAFAEIAIAYVFGGSAIVPGLATSWGAELRSLMGRIPHFGETVCWQESGPCVAYVEAFQGLALVLVVALLLGGVARLGRSAAGGLEDRA